MQHESCFRCWIDKTVILCGLRFTMVADMPKSDADSLEYSPVIAKSFDLTENASHLTHLRGRHWCVSFFASRQNGHRKGPTKATGGGYNFAVPSSSFQVAWRGHSAAVSSLAWIHSPPSLLSSSADGLAKIWTADGSALLGQVRFSFCSSRHLVLVSGKAPRPGRLRHLLDGGCRQKRRLILISHSIRRNSISLGNLFWWSSNISLPPPALLSPTELCACSNHHV